MAVCYDAELEVGISTLFRSVAVSAGLSYYICFSCFNKFSFLSVVHLKIPCWVLAITKLRSVLNVLCCKENYVRFGLKCIASYKEELRQVRS